VLDRDRADRVQGIHQSGLLHQQHRAITREGQACADRHPLIFLAEPDEAGSPGVSRIAPCASNSQP
jgi:hypothetical protein